MEQYEVFKLIREALGIRQSEVARRLKVTHAAINRFESGQSTLSSSNVLRMARLLHVGRDFIEGKTDNPFRSRKLIKIFFPKSLLATIDFSTLYFLAKVNKGLDVLFLSIEAITWFYEIPVYAIALKDSDNNIFLFRRWERSVVTAGITGVNKLQIKLRETNGAVKFVALRIEDELYRRIQNWTQVRRQDIEPLFKQASSVVAMKEDEQKLIQLLRQRKIDPEIIIQEIERRNRDSAVDS